MLEPNGREIHEDSAIKEGAVIENKELNNKLFLRLVAKKVTFTNVDFRYTIFDSVYFRGCFFNGCKFTGCKFLSSNLTGSSFIDCDFSYAGFEKTQVDTDILRSEFNGKENLKLKFARSLRLNYQQLGDSSAVNKAIGVELQATEIHLRKAWRSNEPYYRKKYKGIKHLKAFAEWFNFKFLDLVWGNGESAGKLVRSMFFVLLLMSVVHVYNYGDVDSISDYFQSLLLSIQVFLGVLKYDGYSGTYLALIYTTRLIMVGFFMSIVVKRFNRR
ncbi:pentapeptide repeat-containing protein [Cobetia sp. 1CM21F]|uniref:pentapeptide repeat-containing protein n=1 Tax=Cobetia sp. 1CM21F TaxID=2929163 RepID=UPI0020C0DFCC|nr:pentapeptide repeat-containing protein [Cobetia sp. 1CM21F]MCK8066411.1 pentapeptide repeat-containing protein [Cobetia sp. 1CM21F]